MSLSLLCSRVKYLRKPSPLSNYLMNCSLADSEPLYISQGSPSASYPPFNFQHPQMCLVEMAKLKSCRTVTALLRKDGAVCPKPARHDVQTARRDFAARFLRDADRLCREFAAAEAAAVSPLQTAAGGGGLS